MYSFLFYVSMALFYLLKLFQDLFVLVFEVSFLVALVFAEEDVVG